MLAVLLAPGLIGSLVLLIAVFVWRLRGGAWAVCMAVAGSAWCLATVSAGLTARPAPNERIDRTISGEIVAPPKRAGDAVRVDLETPAGRMRLSWYGSAQPFELGSRWRLCVRLRAPRAMVNPGGYDASAAALSQRRIAVGYIRECAVNARLRAPEGIPALRSRMARALEHGPGGELLAALVLGDDSAITRATKSVLRATGTSHLFVVSGLHVSMVAAFVMLLARFVLRPLVRSSIVRPLVGMVGLLVACGYVLLAGAGLPAQRALVMAAVGIAAHVAGRRILALDSWLLAMAAVLLLDPLAPLGIGFWLSFGVVAALVAASLAGAAGLPSLVRAQCVAFLATLPVLFANGDGVPLCAPIVNAVAIPVVGWLVVPAALAGAVAWISGAVMAADVLWGWSGHILSIVIAGLRLAASTGAVVDVPLHSSLLTALAVLAGVSSVLPAARERRLWVFALGLVAALPTPVDRPETFRVWVLDVGQGLSVLVETRAHTLLYDTGPGSPEGSTLAAEVLPSLGRLGRRLDRVIVSHGDADHAGGYLDPLTIRALLDVPTLAGEPERLPAGLAEACRRGKSWQWDGVHFEILHGASGASSNDRSCVLWVSDGRYDALLPGDITAGAERLVARWLTTRGVQLDLLVAPHHGSATSSSPALLARLRSADVIVSAGHLSRFGHPHPRVLERYRRAGARVWNTASSGALLWSEGKVRRRLRCDPRLWRPPCG